jgi:hypothetical protein
MFTGTGLVCMALGTWARLHGLDGPFNFYDEGLLLTDAYLLLLGGAPYRDFYSNYPPGVFLLIEGVWKLTGISALSFRLLGLVFQLAVAVLAGRVAARMRRRRFSWFACGVVSIWTSLLGPALSAWLVALAALLLFVERLIWALEAGDPKRFVVAGVALGLVGCFRHDLFVYFVLIFGLAWALPAALSRALHLAITPRRLAALVVLGALIPLAAVWISPIMHAGIPRIVDDLFITQVRYVMPARVLPLPNLLTMTPVNVVKLPAFLSLPFEGAVALNLLGPLVAAAMVGLPRVRGRLRPDLGLLAMVCTTIAVIPQMMGRTDVTHAAYCVTPSLIWVAVVMEEFRDRVRAPVLQFTAAMLPVLVFLWAVTVRLPVRPVWAWPRYTAEGSYTLAAPRPGFGEPDPAIARARQAVFQFTEEHTLPGEAVYFGTAHHDRVFINEADLYFLADRRPGTRYVQFDPNVVTRRDVQEEMIASLERHHVRLVVLSSRVRHFEDQPGVLPGSTLFDEYLRGHFVLVKSHPPYVIYVRRPDRRAGDGR